MKKLKMSNALSGLTTCVAMLFGMPAHSETTTSEPVQLIVGFATGGSNDAVARIVSKKAAELLGVPIVVQNQPGANGSIAAAAVARARPDGQTLLIASPSMLAIAPHVTPDLPYDPVKDFVG